MSYSVSEETFRFMEDLWNNNSKPWFDGNRKRYDLYVRTPMKEMAESLSDPVSTIFPEFSGKAKISRINHDLRFHQDRPPYKEHVWISFATRDSNADLFVAIGRNGWSAGCGTGAGTRKPLDDWRQNVLSNADIWRRYGAAFSAGGDLEVFTEAKYKKALYPDIPPEFQDIVQAKGVWILQKSQTSFTGIPEQQFFQGLCRIFPIFLFMYCKPNNLLERFSELGDLISAPDDATAKLWATL